MATKNVWFAAIGLHGLFADKPIELTWTDKDGFDYWVNYDYDTFEKLENLGSKDRLVERYNDRVMFVSRDKSEVEHFILGVDAVMRILRRITGI